MDPSNNYRDRPFTLQKGLERLYRTFHIATGPLAQQVVRLVDHQQADATFVHAVTRHIPSLVGFRTRVDVNVAKILRDPSCKALDRSLGRHRNIKSVPLEFAASQFEHRQGTQRPHRQRGLPGAGIADQHQAAGFACQRIDAGLGGQLAVVVRPEQHVKTADQCVIAVEAKVAIHQPRKLFGLDAGGRQRGGQKGRHGEVLLGVFCCRAEIWGTRERTQRFFEKFVVFS